LPKDCPKYSPFLIAKTRSYYTSGSNVNNGDGALILPTLKTDREVKQFNTFIENEAGKNTRSIGVNNSNENLKKISMNLYQKMLTKEYYKKAYDEIKSKEANMTPGFDKETLDGFSNDQIDQIIESLKNRSFKFKPSRTIEILKPDGKLRKIGIPSLVDKIIQKVFKKILEEIYEPIFLSTSHGFRPNKGTHTPLQEIKK
jgi:retron-type reverse transcriptase